MRRTATSLCSSTAALVATATGRVESAGVVQIARAFVHGDLRYAKDLERLSRTRGRRNRAEAR